jgi:predicted DsbA family dithiol-disulfide isomerase
MTAVLKIDVVSDVACPWCAVGLFAMQRALHQLKDSVRAELRFLPFELNPNLREEGEDLGDYLTLKYGSTPEQQAQMRDMIAARGAEVGFAFAPQGRGRIYNTFDAHRLLDWALGFGNDAQLRLKTALLHAYQGRAERINDHAVLLHAVEEAGLDRAAAQAVLDSDAHAQAVRDAEQWSRDAGIHSVPAFIINERYLISGGQPVEVFAQSLREIAANPEEPDQDTP